MSTACLIKITQQKLRDGMQLELIYLNHAKTLYCIRLLLGAWPRVRDD